MISLPKKEIFSSIIRVGKVLESIVSHPDSMMSKRITKEYLLHDEAQYYRDYRIFVDMISLRLLSYFEDSYLDLINNDELNFDEIKNRMFVNPEDAKRFSNKQIIKYIRNAVSHSDEKKELFRISPNGRFIEIELNNTKPIPFHIKTNCTDLLKIVHIGLLAAKGNYYTLIDKKGKKVYRFYFKNINKEKLHLPSDTFFGTDEIIKIMEDFFNEKGITYEKKEYPLIPEQIELLNDHEKKYREIMDQFPEQQDTLDLMLYNTLIPLANEKIYSLYSRLQLLILLNKYPEYTYNQFKEKLANGCLNAFERDDYNENMSELEKSIHDLQKIMGRNLIHFVQMMKYLWSMTELTNNEFLTYYFSCMCEEDIIIDGRRYSKDNYRDAFVHGRFFTCLNGDIMCFDTANGKNNDYNFYWMERLPLKSAVNSCYDSVFGSDPLEKRK